MNPFVCDLNPGDSLVADAKAVGLDIGQQDNCLLPSKRADLVDLDLILRSFVSEKCYLSESISQLKPKRPEY
jgi:hypothetical protein